MPIFDSNFRFYKNHHPTRLRKQRYKLGSSVRIALDENKFDKNVSLKFSPFPYTINGYNLKYGIYSVKDSQGKQLKKRFYPEELRLSNHNNKILVERVIRLDRSGNFALCNILRSKRKSKIEKVWVEVEKVYNY